MFGRLIWLGTALMGAVLMLPPGLRSSRGLQRCLRLLWLIDDSRQL